VLLELSNLSLSVGSSQLLDGVSGVHLLSGQRVALVGANGCGKSTLLRALAQRPQDDYFLLGAGGLAGRLATTAQQNKTTGGSSAILLVEQDALQWARLLEMADLAEDDLRDLTMDDALDLAAASGAPAALEDLEAWRRLGVATERHGLAAWSRVYRETPIGRLSPGCALRAYVALALARRDIDLLLLDEPTNHLDVESIVWLEKALVQSGKAVVFVSHDAAFCDVVATRVWSVDAEHKTLTTSATSYSAFRRNEALAREQQRRAYDAQQDRQKRLTHVADKLRHASKTGERHKAKDHDVMQRDFKRDRAGRSGKKAKAVETLRDAELLKNPVERVVDRAPLRIDLDDAVLGSGGDAAITMTDVVLGYDDDVLVDGAPVSLRVDLGERVAIVGENGVGKSTLLRTLTGAVDAIQGAARLGRDLKVGNLMQEHESLPRHRTARQYIADVTGLPLFEAGSRIIRYGLTLRQVDRPIAELNPGARARAILASFALTKVNALILDEPSNHLDDEALQEVIATLNHYKGTVLVVSHNRAFLDALDLTRIYRLSSDGLTEIDSLDAYVAATEDAVNAVVADWLQG